VLSSGQRVLPSDPETARRITAAEEDATTAITRRCTDAAAAALGACADTADGLAACVLADHREHEGHLLEVEYGATGPVGARASRRCQQAIATAGRTFLARALREHARCLAREDRAGNAASRARRCLGPVAAGALVPAERTSVARFRSRARSTGTPSTSVTARCRGTGGLPSSRFAAAAYTPGMSSATTPAAVRAHLPGSVVRTAVVCLLLPRSGDRLRAEYSGTRNCLVTVLPTRRRLSAGGRLGMTEVRVRVVNLADARRFADVDLVVDSGAIYSVVPAGVLRRIGVAARETQTFGLANGETVRRAIGDVRYEIGDRSGAAPVIFGRRGDASLLGVVTLEALGLHLDPLRRRLRPLRLIIA
jgi:predicted aspartyl protease